VIVMAFDEQGQADTSSGKVEICARAYRDPDRTGRLPARGHHLRPEHLRGRAPASRSTTDYAVDFIEAVAEIKRTLPAAHASRAACPTSPSRSAATTTVREAIHSVFLYHAIKAGLDMGIVNAGHARGLRRDRSAELRERRRGRRPEPPRGRDRAAAGRSPSVSQRRQGRGDNSKTNRMARRRPVDERLSHALVKGIDRATSTTDTEEARLKLRPARC
jgi:5-methyltetrahydrofolate--homocysteine methyltransferase